jgi:molybdate transport system substrate-binding protein
MRALCLSLFIILISQGCKQGASTSTAPEVETKPELLIYCENGMVSSILEISTQFEAQYNCKVRIQNDCSKNLIGLINYSQKGDLFIPDSYQAIAKLSKANPNVIADSLYIGVNPLVFIVKKGNPETFDASLLSLSKRSHAVLLANPETSSLGFETKKLLQETRLYDPVMTNALALSVDSRGIIRSVINGEASVAIDWLSSYHFNSNKNSVDTLSIQDAYDVPRVFAAVLRSSEYPGLAQSFLATLSSGYGAQILAKHGIHKRRTTIF